MLMRLTKNRSSRNIRSRTPQSYSRSRKVAIARIQLRTLALLLIAAAGKAPLPFDRSLASIGSEHFFLYTGCALLNLFVSKPSAATPHITAQVQTSECYQAKQRDCHIAFLSCTIQPAPQTGLVTWTLPQDLLAAYAAADQAIRAHDAARGLQLAHAACCPSLPLH